MSMFKRFKKEKPANNSGKDPKTTEEPSEDDFTKAGLSDAQVKILKGQTGYSNDAKATIFTVYRYASPAEWALIALSSVCSIAAGVVTPLMIIVFGNLVGDLSDPSNIQAAIGSNGNTASTQRILYLVYLAIASLGLEWIATAGWQHTGRRIARKVREEYLRTLLKQNIGFFDTFGAGKMTSHITADMAAIQEAISEKVGLTLATSATMVGSFIVGYIRYWRLALILTSGLFAIMLFLGMLSVPMQASNKQAGEGTSEAATVVDEAFSAIKTVLALNMQDRLKARYSIQTRIAERWSIRSKAYMGMMLAIMMFIIQSMYGLAFWQGSRFQRNADTLDIASIIITLFAIMTGSFSVAMTAPNFQAFNAGTTSAAVIFRSIDRVSPIDPSSDNGLDASKIKGEIDFKNVRHVYPSRVTTNALQGYNLHIPAGKTTALVGPSGGGKSTVVGLLQRFYNTVEGSVTVDGVEITEYNLNSLRAQISVVSQEPVLFSLSVRDNIAFGISKSQRERLSEEEITKAVTQAAIQAYAHEFVERLPQKYDTPVGERGVLLSGGQRQRLAIARALVSNPKILLFDEATSALDTDSERIVQAAIQEASRHRTTIVIAHRLSTIRDADSIAVVVGGQVGEQGTHAELIARGGTYKKLVDAQALSQEIGKGVDVEKAAEAEAIELELSNTTSLTKTLSKTVSLVRRASMIRSDTDLERGCKALADGKVAEKKYSWWDVVKFVYHYNKEEKWLLLVGCALSLLSGMVQPVAAVLFAKSIFAIVAPQLLALKINFWAAMYLLVGVTAFLAISGRGIVFGIASARLTARLRTTIFAFTLRQEAQWFDKAEHSAGALTSMLSTEPDNASGISGAILGTLLDGAVTLFGGMILSLAIGWKLALVCISVVPVILVSGFVRVSMLARFQIMAKKTYEESAATASEYISGIRTVASLSKEQAVWQHYHDQLLDAEAKSTKWVILSSLFFALSQASQFMIFALVFWYGGKLVGRQEYGPQQFFICLQAVIFGAQSAASFFGFGPDITKTRVASERLIRLLSADTCKDQITLAKSEQEPLQGHIQLDNVHFSYPGRQAIVLDGLSIDIPAGSFVALVGHSGCGKSTVISLASRLYHPTSGSITIDGTNLEDLNAHELRTQLSVVAQEPVLFSGSIRENLLMGLPVDEQVSEERISKACQDANIESLISSLPDGYNTTLGNKGVQLSGGQRQRLAIARTLLRNPKILLLDEATSALDSESEKLVQEALDKAAEGRTTISVAHRLSTIQKADKIFVLQSGKLVESGTHSELLQRKGRYSQFVKEQDLGSTR